LEIFVENIIHYDNGIEIILQLPEELLGENLIFEIKRRSIDFPFSFLKQEIISTSSNVVIKINSSDFRIPHFLMEEEVWDLNISTNITQLKLKKNNSEINMQYLRNEWYGFKWKTYWTKDNFLAIYIKQVDNNLQFSINELFISKLNNIFIKVEISGLNDQDSYFLLLNGQFIKEKSRINNNVYFEVPVANLQFDSNGNYRNPIYLLCESNTSLVKIQLIWKRYNLNLNTKNNYFHASLLIEKDTMILKASRKKKGIAVIGSCVTRDNFNREFNHDYKKYYEFILLQNQTSIISLVSNPIKYITTEINNIGEWEGNQIRNELSKSFFNQLQFGDTDYIVLDFFSDVYFGVVQIDDSFITNNHWVLHKTDLYKNLPYKKIYRLDENFEFYFDMWQNAINKLFERIQVTLPDAKVILHKARFADKYINQDGGISYFENAEKVPKYNRYWSILDNYVQANFDVIPINVDKEKIIGTYNHKWGKFNVHYDISYYHEFLVKLRGI